MVALSLVHESNEQIPQALPPDLVVVVTGGTNGIGEATLKQLTKLLVRPKIYIIGRSQEAGTRIISECKNINSDGQYIFIQKSFDLLKNTAEAIEEIKSKEKKINILILSAGSPDLSKTITTEGLHRMPAVQIYSRILFIIRLLPLLQAGAPQLARVISVAGGSKEGVINVEDWPGLKLSHLGLRGHGTSLATLSYQRIVNDAPEVTIINAFPGWVMTDVMKNIPGLTGVLLRTFLFFFKGFITVPLDECAARLVFLATTSAYKAQNEIGGGVPLVRGLTIHPGANGKLGSGVYSLNEQGEGPGDKAINLLQKYNEDGTADKGWAFISSQFERILGRPN